MLRDIHHIVLIRDDVKKDDAPAWTAPDFDTMDVTFGAKSGFKAGGVITLVPDEETTVTAVAATQDKMPIDGILFTWESDDDNVSVDNGVITANRIGTAEITVAAVGRGIVITFDVSVQGSAAKVAVTPKTPATGPFALVVGGTTKTLTAVVTDADDNEINVPVTWASAPPGIVSVSGDGEVSGIGAGTATVTASAGGKTSNGVRFRVTDFSDPNVRIRVLFTTTTQIPVAADTTTNTAGDVVVSIEPAAAADLALSAAFSHRIVVERLGVTGWANVGAGTTVDWKSANTGILVANGSVATDAVGEATVRLVLTDDATATPVVWRLGLNSDTEHAVDSTIGDFGTTELEFSTTGALDALAPVTIVNKDDL